MNKIALISFLFLLTGRFTVAQTTCTDLGQNPATAFPVCGTTVFNQGSVSLCGGFLVPTKCTDFPTVYTDINPYWYKFTCFATGTLEFLITPTNLNDDYDWQLFDVTGHNPADVFTDTSLFVSCNWSGLSGITGASSAGTSLINCQGGAYPLLGSPPTLLTGHNYLLLVSHFTNTQEGYSLSFGGGTADITNPLDPHAVRAAGGCDGITIAVKLNKKMRCNTLAANGSDFSLDVPGINIISASSPSCTTGFDVDSVILTLDNPLIPGNYNVRVKKGDDTNTLKDLCDREIPENELLPLTIFPLIPTPMDSLTKPGCAPQTLELVFSKPILCSSIEPNGTDFTIAGPYPVAITGATGVCNADGLTTRISIQLGAALQKGGNFILRLNRGTDTNTLLDNCTQETPEGSVINFTIKDTVNADFTYSIVFGCVQNVVNYAHDGANGVNSWNWNFDDLQTSNLQNPVITYADFTEKRIRLIVSNGVCSDTSFGIITFDNYMLVNFEATALVCPGDEVNIKNSTAGNIINWSWTFGNGNASGLEDPPAQTYNATATTYSALIKLIVTNIYGCKDSLAKLVQVINNCFIAVPSAFSPNGDGLNDYLYPLNAYKAANLSFSVYNRFGQLLFYTNDWTNKWDGKFKGQGADPGTYAWILTYTNMDTNKRIEQKGTTVLIR